MFGIGLGGLGGVLGFLKIGAVAAPLIYILSIVADYKSQAVKINNLQHENARILKQNEYWEGRYLRIVGANRNKKSAIVEYETVIDKCCRRKFDTAFRAHQQNALARELFGEGMQ